tara:strand:+ start:693 stop:824 length:132 start_codon:yes stop_codon:yes gene_type:complete
LKIKRTKKYQIIEEKSLIVVNVIIFAIFMVVIAGCAALLVSGL